VAARSAFQLGSSSRDIPLLIESAPLTERKRSHVRAFSVEAPHACFIA